MKTPRVLIVDDEAPARLRLRTMLEELDVEIVGEARDGVQALELVRERAPDVILLDIAMPEIDGFDVARHLPRPRPIIVFQTAHSEHAVKAFEHEALDYVVKPVSLDRLRESIERVRQRLEKESGAALPHDLLERLQRVIGSSDPKPRLLVRDGLGHRLLPLREVIRFVAEEGGAVAITATGKHGTDYTLSELEPRTAGEFVRTNRSDLVNLECIDRYQRNDDGTAELRLKDGSKVHVSRRRATDVKAALE